VDFEEKGNAGIEKGLDDDLRGKPGRTRLLTDVHRRGIDSHESTPAKPGLAITLTIDERLQFVAEREIAAAVALHHAESGSVVVMNPYNGDVLAMASYPTFDPNLPLERGQDPKPRMNHAISVPFEPGSVFKGQRDHVATGAGGVGDRQRRHAGEAASGAQEGQPNSASGHSGARAQAGKCNHDASDDGRRRIVRHRHQGASGRLFERR
jgi:cell division protein FtsI (penicillin-binding protein 3)